MVAKESNIENIIIEEFQKIAENPRRDKVDIEHSPEVERFSKMLFKDSKWYILLNVIKTGLEKPIIVPSYDITLSDIVEYVRILAERQYECSLQYVSRLKSQISGVSSEMSRYILEKLREFLNNRILIPKPEVLKICRNDKCKEKRKDVRIEEDNGEENCEYCGSRLWKLFKCTVNEQVKKSIFNNQFLEIYIKECLKEAGLKLLYVKINKKRVSTSITYSPLPERPVEIDVAGIRSTYMAICECKTVKLTQNIVDQKLPKINTLIEYIQDVTQQRIKAYYFLITTELVDPNLRVVLNHYPKDFKWLVGIVPVERNELQNLKDIIKERFKGIN